ncbi:MAG: hypothetical protein Q8K58_15305 [Acidimicrobiales bacterium]|nr:hypothetical protein [Acidimicrobiales bacterium]
MAIAVHIVNTANPNVRTQYEDAWKQLDEQDADHPAGRVSHTAWLVGDELHVLDVWESQEQMDAFMQTLGPILEGQGMDLVGPPESGELLNVVVPS